MAPEPPTTHSLLFDQLVWHPVDPGNANGPRLAPLWGKPTEGAFGAMLWVPAGFESPIHVHTHDERVIQLRGRSLHWTRDGSKETAPAMTPGDYLMMPGGVEHVSAAADEDSIEFITMDGAFDFSVSDAEVH